MNVLFVTQCHDGIDCRGAPSWHNADVPGALEGLILRLLAKAPEDRPDGAAGVRVALAAMQLARVDREDPRNDTTTFGEWLAAHIPDAEAWIDDENGHLTMIQRRAAEVQDWLRSHS